MQFEFEDMLDENLDYIEFTEENVFYYDLPSLHFVELKTPSLKTLENPQDAVQYLATFGQYLKDLEYMSRLYNNVDCQLLLESLIFLKAKTNATNLTIELIQTDDFLENLIEIVTRCATLEKVIYAYLNLLCNLIDKDTIPQLTAAKSQSIIIQLISLTCEYPKNKKIQIKITEIFARLTRQESSIFPIVNLLILRLIRHVDEVEVEDTRSKKLDDNTNATTICSDSSELLIRDQGGEASLLILQELLQNEFLPHEIVAKTFVELVAQGNLQTLANFPTTKYDITNLEATFDVKFTQKNSPILKKEDEELLTKRGTEAVNFLNSNLKKKGIYEKLYKKLEDWFQLYQVYLSRKLKEKLSTESYHKQINSIYRQEMSSHYLYEVVVKIKNRINFHEGVHQMQKEDKFQLIEDVLKTFEDNLKDVVNRMANRTCSWLQGRIVDYAQDESSRNRIYDNLISNFEKPFLETMQLVSSIDSNEFEEKILKKESELKKKCELLLLEKTNLTSNYHLNLERLCGQGILDEIIRFLEKEVEEVTITEETYLLTMFGVARQMMTVVDTRVGRCGSEYLLDRLLLCEQEIMKRRVNRIYEDGNFVYTINWSIPVI